MNSLRNRPFWAHLSVFGAPTSWLILPSMSNDERSEPTRGTVQLADRRTQGTALGGRASINDPTSTLSRLRSAGIL